jgi:hypothetical protein
LRHRVPDLSAYAPKMRVPLLRASLVMSNETNELQAGSIIVFIGLSAIQTLPLPRIKQPKLPSGSGVAAAPRNGHSG